MAYLLGVLVIAVGVMLSIALHEIGHLVPAKRFGVKCTQYMVGFGPTLWSTRRGETEYGVKAIPLGGYVRMIGMFPPKPGRPPRARASRLSLMVEQAREDAQREIAAGDGDRLFYTRSVPKRLVIMLGGPTMNLLIAVVLLTGIVTVVGLPGATTRLAAVSECVLPADAPDRDCAPTDPPAPANAAGLLPGDVITAFDGVNVDTWDDVRTAIRANGDRAVVLTVERDGASRQVTVTPIVADRPVLDEDTGAAVAGEDGRALTERVGFLGVSPTQERVRQPLTAVPGVIGSGLYDTARLVLRIPKKMVGVVKAALGLEERDPTGPISLVGVGRFAGEVTSAQAAAAAAGSTDTWIDTAGFLLTILASLNLALFVFNLVPLLPLDGGHVAGALWEGLRRQVARLRRRPDPGPVDIARALPLAYAVASVFIFMSVLLIYADIVSPVRLGG